jgi:hypothetical protein
MFPIMAVLMAADIEIARDMSRKRVEGLTKKLMDKLVHEFRVMLGPKSPATSAEKSIGQLKKSAAKMRSRLANLEKF